MAMSPVTANRTTGDGFAPPAEPATAEIAAARRSPRVSRAVTAAQRSRVAGPPHRCGSPAGTGSGLLDDLPGRVVAMLLGPEDPPGAGLPLVARRLERPRRLGTEDPLRGRVAVRDVDTGDLVVAFVLAEAGVVGVERRRRVAALCQPADRHGSRIRVVLRDVEQEPGVERVALPVQLVAGI